MIKDRFVALQFKSRKSVHIYELDSGETTAYWQIDNAVSRNGKSFCVYDCFLALRNLKNKCFEVLNVETKESMMQFAYEDIWYYNNYHVLGHIFVFPHYMKVTFFDSRQHFKQISAKGVDFDWYKNDEQKWQTGTVNKQKKFVILKDSNTICFDSGEGKIQVYNWRLQNEELVFDKTCSLRDH